MVETIQNSSQVVVIDPDAQCREMLTGSKYIVHPFATAADALAADPDQIKADAIVIDAGCVFDASHVSHVAALRQKWPFAPMIVLATKDQVAVASEALALGASDYIVRPLDEFFLDARIQVRMAEFRMRSNNESFAIGDIQVDAGHRIISRDDRRRALSPTEMSLLHCLATAKGTIVNREVMKRRCWGQAEVSDNALNRKLHEVRRALSSLSAQVSIKTIYGTGFVLEVKNQSSAALKHAGAASAD